MIYEVVHREDGFYEFGDINDDSLEFWAVYYHDSQTDISRENQITSDPVNYGEGALPEGWIGIYSDSSREELINELIDNRGKNVI